MHLKNMKIHIKISVMLLALLGITSCKDNLEESPYSSLGKDVAFKDEDGLNQATIGVYQRGLRPIIRTFITGSFSPNRGIVMRPPAFSAPAPILTTVLPILRFRGHSNRCGRDFTKSFTVLTP
jgi:hypothetical protein